MAANRNEYPQNLNGAYQRALNYRRDGHFVAIDTPVRDASVFTTEKKKKTDSKEDNSKAANEEPESEVMKPKSKKGA